MGIETVPHPPNSPDLAPCNFWSFPKLRGCRYKTNEEMKEAVTKVIDTLTQEDFHGAIQKLLERYNKCFVTRGDYFEVDKSFMCVLSIKVPIRKKSGNLFNDPRICLMVCIFPHAFRLQVFVWIQIYFNKIIFEWEIIIIDDFFLFSWKSSSWLVDVVMWKTE